MLVCSRISSSKCGVHYRYLITRNILYNRCTIGKFVKLAIIRHISVQDLLTRVASLVAICVPEALIVYKTGVG